jgi:hypothetical protein
MYLSYNTESRRFTIRVKGTEYNLPPDTHPQFKMDTQGYFISYIDNEIIIRIYVSDQEYTDIFDEYVG